MKRTAIFVGFAILLGLLVWKRIPADNRSLTGTAMGTSWTLVWRGETPPELRREVVAVLEHWEQALSQWRKNSDLSRHNRGEAATPDLLRVIELAESIRLASRGAFDHRLLEQVHAAGFGPAGQGIDLSAIGKGFAVDRVGERLRELGVDDFVFNLGGDLLAGSGEWPIEIEAPLVDEQKTLHQVVLRERGLATSGNYRQFLPGQKGLRSHLIDPATGAPVERPPSSVTVTAPDCATADAWATALFILGPDFDRLPPDVEAEWHE